MYKKYTSKYIFPILKGLHRSSISRIAKKNGIKMITKKIRPFLTDDHKKQRKEFANKYLENPEYYSNLMITDECSFFWECIKELIRKLDGENSKDQKFGKGVDAHEAKINVWGGVLPNGEFCYEIIKEKTNNSAVY